MNHSERNGFTLVELLVVIAIIGILVALLLPAIQAAREASRRSQCGNNLKQLAVAMHNYHDVHKRFPPGQYVYIDSTLPLDWNRYSWFFSILPQVEQQAMFELYDAHLRAPKGPLSSYSYTELKDDIKKAVVPTFLCPSDPANPKTENGSSTTNQQGFHGNYMLNAGDSYFNSGGYANSAQLDGVFFVLSKTGFRDIVDGTATTLLASEIILVADGGVGSGQEDIRGRYHNVRHAGALFSTLFPPNTSQPDRHNYCLNKVARAPCTATGTDVVVSARSYHTGGVNASLADASTRFINQSIDLTVYHALGTRQGGDVVGQY
jgi:prepilin-type N-terminal cleavage/methylation domain-containing protein